MPEDPGTPLFASVVCSLDGTETDQHAARQAAILAGPGGRLEFLAVIRGWGYGADPQAALSVQEAYDALAAAQAIAQEAGVEAEVRSVDGGSRTDTLLNASRRHDLLVVGADRTTRIQGILARATPSTLVHLAGCPVLVARPPRAPDRFPGPIMLAHDGSPSSRGAARITVGLVARREVAVELITPPDLDESQSAIVAADAAALYRAGLAEPVRVREHGHAAQSIIYWAERLEVSLIVIGSRGLLGGRALASARRLRSPLLGPGRAPRSLRPAARRGLRLPARERCAAASRRGRPARGRRGASARGPGR